MMRVRYYGPFWQRTGDARAGHDYLAALVRAGVEVSIFPLYSFDTEDLADRYQHLLQYVCTEDSEYDVAIVHESPPALVGILDHGLIPNLSYAPKIALTTWETSQLPMYLIPTL